MIRTRRELLAQAAAATGVILLPGCATTRPTPRFSEQAFTLGVASGYPTPSSLVLWTRLAPEPLAPDGGMPAAPVPVQWQLAADERFGAIVASGEVMALPALGHSVRVEAAGLSPGRPYWYRFFSGGAESPVGRTRTAPAADALAPARFGLACCQRYEVGHYAAFAAMAADDLDLIIHVGDYIYENAGYSAVRSHALPEPATLAEYRQRYALYKLDPRLQQAHASAPWVAVSDDHEVDNDYAGAISQDNDDPVAFLARRAAAYQAYYEHLPLPPRMQPSGPDMSAYTRHAYGDLVDIYLLDGRQYRSPHACGHGRFPPCPEMLAPERTMLGAAQETWLETAMASSRKRFNLVAQQTVFAAMDQLIGPEIGYWTDGWSGYPAARARLVDFIAARDISNPVILSGDIHAFLVNDVHARPGDPDSAIVATEIVTTSITSRGGRQETMDAWKAENPNIRFANNEQRGYTRLAVTARSLKADLIAVDDVADPDSGTHLLASWYVNDGEPGAVS